jgi:hypothetical protein
MKSCIRKIVSLIAQHIDPDVEVHKIKIGESEEIEEIPLSRPKSLSNLYELTLYRENCDKNCHPTGECDSCFASDYYYKKYPDGWVRGQWYCRASPTLEEFEPDYRKKSLDRKEGSW